MPLWLANQAMHHAPAPNCRSRALRCKGFKQGRLHGFAAYLLNLKTTVTALAMDQGGFPADSEQDRILGDAKQAIKRNAYSMRKAREEDNMREALRFSAAMLSELRTSQLSPQKYYELYMLVFDQLVNLESFFGDERSKGRTYSELYELVQHAGNVLPRLYLMVAVGCLYIKSKEAAAQDILRDLVEMCKGVQHPTRGLFLRSYLCQRSRAVLPDAGSAYEGPGGGVQDAIDFLLSNFVEMNKLWVRMQHQGSARDKEKREKERQQLADLVGKNLTYISQLDGLGFELYAQQVLPRVMEQVVSCRDDIAQQYLFQAVIQVFPDAFHLGTLDVLLGALPELQPGVKVHTVMASLMDRLAKYAAADKGVMQRLLDMGAFERFRDAIAHIITAQPSMPAVDAVEMYVALMNFTGSVHPNIVENVNQVLAAAHKALSTRGLAGDMRAEKALVTLLTLPITKYDVVTGLGLTEYPLLMGLLRQRTHKELATRIVHTVLDTNTRITSVEKAAMLFRFIQPLVNDEPVEGTADGSGAALSLDDMDDEDVAAEQVLVARLLHSLHSEDAATHFQLLLTAQEQLMKGGPRRERHTLPALGFAGLALVRRVAKDSNKDGANDSDDKAANAGAVTCESLLQWLLNVALSLSEVPEPLLALRLMLAAAVSASEEASLEMLAYEFMEQALLLYEESVCDQRARTTALHTIVGTLYSCHVFSPENRDALVQNTAGYAARLLKRSDQCKAVCACARLYWQDDVSDKPGAQPGVKDAPKVMACLKRAIKIANSAKLQQAAAARPVPHSLAQHPIHGAAATPAAAYTQSYVSLYIEVLNHYLAYLELGVEAFSASVVQQFLDLVSTEVASCNNAAAAGAGESGTPVGGLDPETTRFWQSTLQYIQRQSSAAASDVQARFAQLQLPKVAA